MEEAQLWVRPLQQEYKPKILEREVLDYWRKSGLYERIRESLKGRAKFYFLDGPPYPSSDTPHIGTLWNKILKDVIVRYRRARGYWVVDKPGYDCHGLPIEVKIEQELAFKTKKDIEKFGIDKFVERCKEFAIRNASSMTRWFEEFGVSLDWSRPYMTLSPDYIQAAWWLVKRADEQGLLERGLKVVHWCPRCETALADYEVTEYRVLTDPSIYVKFPVEGKPGHYLLIWTTTPWTLPANAAVMAHPDFEYVWVEVNGERLLLARSRLEAVMREAGVTEYKVVGSVVGRELEGLRYRHPLEEEVEAQRGVTHVVVLSDKYVSAEEGTGLVHCAPGHGEEDFEVGLKYGLPVLSPVDDRGFFTREAGKYAGKRVWEANAEIIADLRAKGALFHEGRVSHRYPVCWRCKTPLLLRATPQWYIRVTHLKERFLEEAQRVVWVPEWAGSARFREWIKGLRDWVISRQRFWGTPAPIWVCERCGRRVVVGSLRELEELAGRKLELPDLHRPWIDGVTLRCPQCGGTMRRVEDVLDVWLDSGVAFYASLGYPLDGELYERLKPVDVIVEGHDQIAGWFFSLMRCGLLAFGSSPYVRVVMHGFVLDEKGREMHKSLGNYVAPDQVLEFEKGGRDVLRWYVLRNTVWEDLRFSWKGLEEVYDDLNVLWNVYVFASTYMGVDRFNPKEHPVEKYLDALRPEDRWLLSRIEKLALEVTKYLESYEVHRAARALRDFIVEDVSRWYIRLVRPRVWVEENVPDKLAAYSVLYYALRRFLVLAAPFIPFAAEWIYRSSFRVEGDPESVHMLEWPQPNERFIDEELERRMALARRLVERAWAARMKAGIKLRVPLPCMYVFTDSENLRVAVEALRPVIEAQANVRKVVTLPLSEARALSRLEVKPAYGALGPVFRSETPRVVEALRSVDALQLKLELESRGFAVVRTPDGKGYTVTRDMVKFEEVVKEGFVAEALEEAVVALELQLGAEEAAEGLARDIVRRIQFMRKELRLPVDAFIEVTVHAPEEVAATIEGKIDYIVREVRAARLKLAKAAEEVAGELVRDWDLDGLAVRIGISRASGAGG